MSPVHAREFPAGPVVRLVLSVWRARAHFWSGKWDPRGHVTAKKAKTNVAMCASGLLFVTKVDSN